MQRKLLRLLCCVALAAPAAGCRTDPPPASEPGVARTADPAAEPATAPTAAQPVTPGLEVLLRDSVHLVRGRRVGFITNQTAITSDGRSGIDLLAESPDVNLVALFGPEHGLRGGIEGGVRIADGRDAQTGVQVYSLYGQTQRPTAAMLRDVEVLLFDMQDIGARPYTFVWTMAMAMEVAARQNIPFIVLDRPNPITSRIGGPLMEMEMRNVGQPITGYYPVPLRHGMTVGEVARYINAEYGIGARLTVVPAAGWRGDMWFDETGLPWIDPSPNIRSLDAALHYAGVVLFEATNVTVGRGTDAPMSYIGAPWLDNRRLLERMGQYDLPGVELTARSLTPTGSGWVPYRDTLTHVVHLRVTDRDTYRPVDTALALMVEIRRMHPERFRILNQGFTQMIGSRWARAAVEAGEDPRGIVRRWESETAAWREVRERYRLYPTGGRTGGAAR
jgi:uncharacterized protein YbbC (DUF1343 family)